MIDGLDKDFSALDGLASGDDFSALDELAGTPKPPKRAKTPAKTPRSLSQTELEDAARQAGWPEDKIKTFGAIGMAESALDKNGRAIVSSYNPGRGAGGKPTREQSIGPWQINMHPDLNRPYDRKRLASDPIYNAKVALELFNDRQSKGKDGFTHWGAYTDQRYKQFLNTNSLDDIGDDTTPQVDFKVNGLSKVPEPSQKDIDAFQRMFGKKVSSSPNNLPSATPQPVAGGNALPPSSSAALPTTPEAPKYDFEQTGKLAGGLVYKGKVGNAYTAENADGDKYTLNENRKAWELAGPAKNAYDTKGGIYTLAPDQGRLSDGQTRRTKDGVNYLFRPDGKIQVEGAVLPPDWATGTTKPVTPLPNDPVAQRAYQNRLRQGIPDTEEFRQKFIQGYNAVKAGTAKTVFNPEDQKFLDDLDLDKVRTQTEGVSNLQTEKIQQAGASAQTQTGAADVSGQEPTFKRQIGFRDKPDNVSNKDWLIQSVVPEIVGKTGLEAVDVERYLQRGIRHIGGTRLEDTPKDSSYNFQWTPDDTAIVQGSTTAKYDALEKLVATGLYVDKDSVSRDLGIDPQIVDKAFTGQDEYADVYSQGQDKKASVGDRSPAAQQIEAYRQAGLIDPDKADKALQTEDAAYNGWLQKTGYADPDFRAGHSEEFKRDLAEVMGSFGSFNALATTGKETAEFYKDKPYSSLLGLGPDYEKAVAASEQYRRPRLSDAEIQKAQQVGQAAKIAEQANPQLGSFGSQFVSGLTSDLYRMSAGAGRILNNIHPLYALARWAGVNPVDPEQMEKFARQADIAGETAQGDGVVFKYSGLAGRGFGGLPGLAVATVAAGGNPILGFGIHSALTHTDRPIAEQIREVTKDTLLGAAFAGIGALGRFAGTAAANKFLTPEVIEALNSPEAEKTFVASILDKGRKIQTLVERGATEGERNTAQLTLDRFLAKNGLTAGDLAEDAPEPAMNPVLKIAMQRAAIAKTLAEKGTSIGLVAATGYTTSRLEGESQGKSIENALLWGAMEAVMAVRGKHPGDVWSAEDIAAANERVVRVPDAQGKPRDILLLDNNGKLEGKNVTGEVPTETVDAQILPKDGEKSVKPPSMTEAEKADVGKVIEQFGEYKGKKPTVQGLAEAAPAATQFDPKFEQSLRDQGATDEQIKAFTPQEAIQFLGERKTELKAEAQRVFTLPLVPADHPGLSRKMDITLESPSGRQTTKTMTARSRQTQLERKGDVIKDLVDCIHG